MNRLPMQRADARLKTLNNYIIYIGKLFGKFCKFFDLLTAQALKLFSNLKKRSRVASLARFG
jgi:hypothetical protein